MLKCNTSAHTCTDMIWLLKYILIYCIFSFSYTLSYFIHSRIYIRGWNWKLELLHHWLLRVSHVLRLIFIRNSTAHVDIEYIMQCTRINRISETNLMFCLTFFFTLRNFEILLQYTKMWKSGIWIMAWHILILNYITVFWFLTKKNNFPLCYSLSWQDWNLK